MEQKEKKMEKPLSIKIKGSTKELLDKDLHNREGKSYADILERHYRKSKGLPN
jgi:hypothetical protein